MEITQEITNNELCCHTLSFNAMIHFFHWHDSFEICQVIKGNCTFRIDGELIKSEPGDILVITGHTVHQFIIERDDTRIRLLQFPTKMMLELPLASLPIKTHIKAGDIDEIPMLKEKLNSLFDIMENEENVKNVSDNPFFKSTACALYLLLQRSFPNGDIAFNKNERQIFFKIVDYINKHFKENITVNSISGALFFSRGKISEIFKKYSGLGINAYINTLRIKNVNRLMIDGRNITEASLESGFQSIRTFNNVYKSITNSTPSAFLKKTLPKSRKN